MAQCDIAVIGVGTMGGNLALNIADQGFRVAVFDAAVEKTREFLKREAASKAIKGAESVAELVGLVRKPRPFVVLVPAGAPVDSVIDTLAPHLDPGDLIIDGGNSHFTDTNRREQALRSKELLFMGMGISGGEAGARHGPSLMPGGPKEAYERVRPILEAAAAKVSGEPCVAYLGSGSAGHYVKMVHNGIEYGLMQLIAETYDLMKRGMKLRSEELAATFERWSRSELNSYLLEITARIFRRKDQKHHESLLIDLILDQARQKGTGKWTSMDAMELLVPTPSVDVAVMMRNLSGLLPERKAAASIFGGPVSHYSGSSVQFIEQLKEALYAAMILTFAQGMALLREASSTYGYGLSLEAVARIWRGGCIIRAALLEEIRKAYGERPDLPNLLVASTFAEALRSRQESLRTVVRTAIDLGIPVPGFMAALGYFDAYRSPWLPANLIQAQRDYFGAHHYARTDMPGLFHTVWELVEGAEDAGPKAS